MLARTMALTAAALLPGIACAQSGPPRGQLPGDVTPKAYSIALRIDPARDRLDGRVEIQVVTGRPLRTLYLNGKDLHVRSALVRSRKGTRRASYEQVDPIGLARVQLARALPAGRHVLVLDYDAPLKDGGIMRAKIGDDWYSWSAFEPSGARTVFPGFDEPRFKTPFTISIQAPAGDLVVSNGVEMRAVAASGGIRHEFAATAPLPTYLLEMAVGPFASASTTAAPTSWRKDRLPIRLFATRDKKDQLAFALANVAPIERLIEDYVAQPFPYSKLDGIATPLWSESAVENAGAILFADDVVLGRGDDPAFLGRFGTDVPHEISHQWFGDLVTPRWWDDLWLNESFAEWLGKEIAQEWRPGLDLGSHDNGLVFVAMASDSLGAVDALRAPVPTPDDVRFTPITYGKGSQVVRMIAAYLGKDRFRAGVRRFLAAHRFGTAAADDFFEALGRAAGEPAVAAAMRTFVEQPGVPVIRFARRPGGYVAHQRRYQMLGSDLPNERWITPMCYRVGRARRCTMLHSGQLTIEAVGGGPLMPNAGGSGYYRFSLDPTDWRELLEDRATLSDDEGLAAADSLWAQFRAGDLDSRTLLAGVRALSAHPTPSVALFGIKALAQLRGTGFIPDRDAAAYEGALRRLSSPWLKGFNPAADASGGSDRISRGMRAALVPLLVDAGADPELARRLARAADAMLAGDGRAVESIYRQAALKAWFGAHDLAAAQGVYARYVRDSSGPLRSDVLKAISGTGDPALAKWLLAEATSDRLSPDDRNAVLTGLSAQRRTRRLALDYALDRDAGKLASDDAAAHLVQTMASGFCSAADEADLHSRLRPLMTGGDAGRVRFSRLMETVHACVALASARQQEMSDALNDRGA